MALKSSILFMLDTPLERVIMQVYALFLNICLIGAAFFGWFKVNQNTAPFNDVEARLGLIIAIMAVIFHLYGQLSIGANWSGFVSVQENHQLVTTGAYSLARHPIYASMLLLALAVYMMTQNLAIFALLLSPFIFAWTRIRREERVMLELFGKSYADYHKTVGPFWPWFSETFEIGLTQDEVMGNLLQRENMKEK